MEFFWFNYSTEIAFAPYITVCKYIQIKFFMYVLFLQSPVQMFCQHKLFSWSPQIFPRLRATVYYCNNLFIDGPIFCILQIFLATFLPKNYQILSYDQQSYCKIKRV